MNSIKDLLPGSMRERTFQLKARRDAGAVWNDPQFVECKKCGRRATRQIWNKAQYVCPNCGVHLPIGGYYRLSLVLDKGSFRELDADLAPQDVLQFPGYPEKLEAQTGKTGLKEAVITATGRIEGTPVVVAVLDSRSNFLFASTDRKDGGTLYKALKQNGILVRHFDAPRIANWLRITIGTPEQMQALVETLDKILEE